MNSAFSNCSCLRGASWPAARRSCSRLWSTDSFIDDNTLNGQRGAVEKKAKRIGLNDFIGQERNGVHHSMIAYLRARVLSIALLLVFGLIFAEVFYLYDLPLEAVGYACALCLALGVTSAALDFYAFRKRRLKYRALAKAAGLGLDALPEPRNALERDAQLVCRALQARLQVRVQRGRNRPAAGARLLHAVGAIKVKTPIAALRLLLTADEPASRTQLDAGASPRSRTNAPHGADLHAAVERRDRLRGSAHIPRADRSSARRAGTRRCSSAGRSGWN